MRLLIYLVWLSKKEKRALSKLLYIKSLLRHHITKFGEISFKTNELRHCRKAKMENNIIFNILFSAFLLHDNIGLIVPELAYRGCGLRVLPM